MEDKKLLIAGVDPGTTIGYAILDIEGNLLRLNSSKQIDLNRLISETITLGKIVLVGTDKAKVPSLVEAFATKLGAKTASPQEDLKVYEKREMTRGFSFSDEHQGDALASALFAYKEIKPLLAKIDSYVNETNKHEIRNKIKAIVITKKISIKSAVDIIEKKNEEDTIIQKVIVEKKLNENDFLRLYNKLKKYEGEVRLIKKYNINLNTQIKNLEDKISARVFNSGKEKLVDFREQRIKFLQNVIKLKDSNLEQFKFLIEKHNYLLSNIGGFYILKKLETLGEKEFLIKNKILNIKRNDMLLVENPNILSHNVINSLKNIVFIIVYKKPVSKKVEGSLPFIFMDAKNIKIEEDEYFGFAEKNNFDAEKDKMNWIKKIIEDYRKEKEELIN